MMCPWCSRGATRLFKLPVTVRPDERQDEPIKIENVLGVQQSPKHNEMCAACIWENVDAIIGKKTDYK